MRDILSFIQDITEGEATSFFSGSTEIIILPFEDVENNLKVDRYYFTGSKDTVSSIRQKIYSQIATSYIHKEEYSIVEMLAHGIWIISLGFILLLTWVDIQFSKKSDFLKISMGSSVGRIILWKILIDAIFYAVIFGTVYTFLKSKILLAYKLNFAFVTLIVFFCLNSLLYTTLLKVDYKEVIYGANINGRLLANTYLLQTIVVILLIVSLSFNLISIKENAKELAPYDTIERLDGYNTLSLTPAGRVFQSEQDVAKLEASIYYEAYLEDKVLLSTFCADINDEPIVVLNEAALSTVVSNPALFQAESESDFIVYIPKNRYSEMEDYDVEFAAATTASDFFGLENYSFEAREYSHLEVVYFDLRNVSELSYGSDLASDPIIVYCNLSKTRVKELLENNTGIDFGDRWANIIFNMEDTDLFSESVKERIDDVEFISVVGLCDQYKSNLIRGVLLNSVLSTFLLILSILLISSIIKMEYLVHAKELALKKILGYSIFQRNMVFLGLGFFEVSIAFITSLFLSKMYGFFDICTLCIVSLIVLFMDLALILVNMAVAEKHNTAHILKGGSL